VSPLTDPLCFGMSGWFDSTDPLVHMDCRLLCLRCPVIERCRRDRDELLDRGMLIEGTWAGELYGAKPPTRRRTCGQAGGWYHHKKHGEESCEDCAVARREYDRARKQRESVA
jgi:hypothetical protein